MFLLEQAEKIEKRLGLPARDVLEKRARRGDNLAISDIMMLEFPIPPPREADREDWRRLIDLAVQCGEIPARLEVDDDGYLPGTDFIGRRDYLAWRNLQSDPPARSRIRIWQAPGQPATDQIEPVLSPAVPQGATIAQVTTRQIALVEAEDAALAALRKKLKREPDFEEWWRYITERDDTGTIADHTDDRLMWTGKDGRNCETVKSTMRNRLTEARKRNPFNL